ncbi:MAG: fluoride efflux transporter CrcB [Anaerolineae bacterium]|nr:fluoride efflux transporter CrcB [Anaerolineae bacterium]
MRFTRIRVETFLLIGIGGFVGANARYFVSTWAAAQFGQTFPLGTLIINVAGSCLLGAFIGWAGNHISLDPRVRLFVAVGFFGAFTTFSTFANESVALARAGDWIGALVNVMSTNILCLGGAFLGLLLGSRF